MRFLFSIFLICIASYSFSQTIKRTKTIANDSVYIGLVNPFWAPIEIQLKPLDSTRAFVKVNPYGLLKRGDTLQNALVLPLRKVSDTVEIDLKNHLSFKATFGNPNTSYDKDFEYELPYPKGKAYRIMQSFGGNFSHNKPASKFAIDFTIPVGDTITAARSGRVFFVKDDSKEHCPTRKCIDKANKIYILHEDGTMAHYVHLDFEGTLVEVGDWVDAKQPIGISGFTGFTTKPHLHFVLYKSGSVSIPFVFKGIKRKKLRQGTVYKNSN